MSKRVILALLIAVGFLGITWTAYAVGDESENTITRAGEGDDPYCRFYSNGISYGYPGDTITFYVMVVSNYYGEDWIEGTTHYGYNFLIDAKLYIWDNSTLDEDGLLVDFTSPAYKGGMTPYNGPNSVGYNISAGSYLSFYSDSSNSYFSFTISSEYVKAGRIEIPVKLVFKVMYRYKDNDQIEYRSRGQMGYIYFDIMSNLAGSDFRGMELNGYEGSQQVPIYAGSRYIRVEGNSIRSSTSTTLTEVDAKLEFFSNQVHCDRSRLYLGDLSTSSEKVMWYVDVESDSPPMQVNGSVTYSYYRGNRHFIEGPYLVHIMVVPTPMICVPQTYNTTEPSITVYQKENVRDFEIEFKNIGNVPIKQATVRMDLDDASFVGQYDYVYDEGDHGTKKYPSTEFYVEDVEPGDFFTAVFPRIGFEHMLPPGDYKIPVDYTATYVDPFDETDLQQRIVTAQWDEAGWNDYMEIEWYRSDPRPVNLEGPYFIMRVLDDSSGPDIEFNMNEGVRAGSVNIPITLHVYNHEYYDVNDVSVGVKSGDMNILAGHGTLGFDPTVVDVKGFHLPGGSGSGPGVLDVSATIDVSHSAKTGRFSLFVTFEGKNDRGETVTVNRTMNINIVGSPGSLEIAGIQSTELLPGEEFEVNITVMNTGQSTLTRAGVMIFAYHNLLSFSNPVIQQIDIEPGAVRYLVFKCTLSSLAEPGTSVSLVAAVSFEDEVGTSVGYMDNGVEYVDLQISQVFREQCLHVLSTETSEIIPGEEFDLKVTVMNRGSLKVEYYEIMVESLNNEITILTPPEVMPGLEPGQTSSVTFRCKASDIMEPGSEITLTTRTKYEDETGEEVDFFEYEGENISIVSSQPAKDTDLSDSVSKTGTIILVGVILFTLILISALVFFIYSSIKREGGGEKKSRKKEKKEEEKTEEKEPSIYDNMPNLPAEESKPAVNEVKPQPQEASSGPQMNLPPPSTAPGAAAQDPRNPFLGSGEYKPPVKEESTSLDELFK